MNDNFQKFSEEDIKKLLEIEKLNDDARRKLREVVNNNESSGMNNILTNYENATIESIDESLRKANVIINKTIDEISTYVSTNKYQNNNIEYNASINDKPDFENSQNNQNSQNSDNDTISIVSAAGVGLGTIGSMAGALKKDDEEKKEDDKNEKKKNSGWW